MCHVAVAGWGQLVGTCSSPSWDPLSGSCAKSSKITTQISYLGLGPLRRVAQFFYHFLIGERAKYTRHSLGVLNANLRYIVYMEDVCHHFFISVDIPLHNGGKVKPQPFFRLAAWLMFSFLSSNYGATSVAKVSQLST